MCAVGCQCCLDSGSASEYLVLEASPAVSNASSGGVYSVTSLQSSFRSVIIISSTQQRYWGQ